MERSLESRVVTNAMIVEVLNSVRKESRWHGRWITDADWCELLRRSAPVLASIDKAKLNKAIGYSKKLKHGFEVWDTNPLGFLRRHYKVGGINTWCYHRASAETLASILPFLRSNWLE
jgi:hypothetical protein